MKRLVSLITALALLLSGVCALAAGPEVTLVPLSYDETGVLPTSAFLLSGYTGETPTVTVNGEITATAEKNADGSFTVTPDRPLDYNRLYTFELTGKSTGTWVFQTGRRFELVGTLPGNYAYNVPVNSGIEFTFTHSDLDLSSIEKSFAIKPRVEGKWELHKETAVFIPAAPLEYDEEYTVTLDGAAMRTGGEDIKLNRNFTFDTEPEPAKETDDIGPLRIYADVRYCEMPSSVAPTLGFYCRRNGDSDDLTSVSVEVFPLDEKNSVSWLAGDITTKALTENLPVPMMSFEYSYSDWEEADGDIILPQPLPNGFYLVRVSARGEYAQTVVQSTDMAAYIAVDTENYVLWLNNIISGEPVVGAHVSLDGAENSAVTDADGLAMLPFGENGECLKVTVPGGETAYYTVYKSYLSKNKYRVLLQTERPLYQPDDTVYLWGAVKPYSGIEMPSELSVELRRGRYYGYYYSYRSSNPLLTQAITADEGVFSAELQLSGLSSGSYTIVLKSGDELLGSVYISVEEYVKPDYSLSLTADKKAIFLGESINYTARASFFEGTALPELELSAYSSYYYFENCFYDGKTDKNGEIGFTAVPQYAGKGEGISTFNMNVRAVLPETGEIASSVSTTVLLNDIDLKLSSGYENGISTVTVHSDKLTTDKVNSGQDWSYIDGPDPGREISGSIVFKRYMKEQVGTEYNYILKRSYPVYRYYTVEEPVSSFSLVTDGDGNARYSFSPAETEGGYYLAKVSATDGLGRERSASATVRTNEFTWYLYDNNYSFAGLVSDKESYDIGDSVELRVVEGGEVKEGRYLFIRDYNGITDLHVGGGVYNTVFDAAPSIYISCIEFEPGLGYSAFLYKALNYDKENGRICIDAGFDKDRYSPGESCTVSIKTTDKDGKPVQAHISLGLVDEALFALRDQSVNSLYSFFAGFGRCVNSIYYSHRYAGSSLPGGSGGGAMAKNPSEESDSGASLRYDFRDTAVFVTAKTDENGLAVLSFDLPHNTTTWRATFAAVNDNGAGDAQIPVVVTMPAFLSWNINETYLIGDIPEIGLSLYGSELSGSETVVFTLTDGDFVASVQSRPFERVNMRLSPLTSLGAHTVTVSASVDGREIDRVQETVTVIDTYNRTVQETVYDSPYDAIVHDGVGNVKITFTDKNRASLLGGIYRMFARAGDRIDQVLANNRAAGLLNTFFGAKIELPEVNWRSYQSDDGGIKLLPYGSSDPELTARLAPYIKDHVDKNLLASYLYGHETEPGALYALAALREPVLDKLRTVAAAENLDPVERLYCVLALCELGELDSARQAYSYIESLYEDFGGMRRILTGTDNDDILEATSLAAVAALYLGRDDAESLYRYSVTNHTSDILINIEIMAYTDAAIKNLPEEKGSVTYEIYGQSYTKEFSGRESFTVELPAANVSEFKVVSASDSVGMVSAAETKLNVEQLSNPHVSIERSYYKEGSSEPTTTFNESDIVEVVLTINYTDQALEGGYIINDYLPSGLELLKGNRRYYSNYFCSGKGQRVRLSSYFYDDEKDYNNTSTLTYYARVVSPGEFTADNATVQSTRSTDILAASGREKVTVTSGGY